MKLFEQKEKNIFVMNEISADLVLRARNQADRKDKHGDTLNKKRKEKFKNYLKKKLPIELKINNKIENAFISRVYQAEGDAFRYDRVKPVVITVSMSMDDKPSEEFDVYIHANGRMSSRDSTKANFELSRKSAILISQLFNKFAGPNDNPLTPQMLPRY